MSPPAPPRDYSNLPTSVAERHIARCAQRMIRAQCVLQDFGLAFGWRICMQRWIAVRDRRR
jgi:hypothetical protein